MSSSPTSETSFEQALERLEEIVSAMEGDRMPLDEMVSSYEEGMRLLRVCRQRIETARKRIEMITAEADGKLTVAAFDPAAASAAEVQEEKARPAPAPARKKKPAEAEDDSDDIRLF